MDVKLICFSQTGNTHQVATAMAATFREAGHLARIIALKKASPKDATEGDLLGVGTPCFSSQAPTPTKEFLRSVPALDGKRAFVFATSGGAPGRVLYDLTRLLRSKGAFEPRPTLRRSRSRTRVGRPFWPTARKQAGRAKAGVGFLRLAGVDQFG